MQPACREEGQDAGTSEKYAEGTGEDAGWIRFSAVMAGNVQCPAFLCLLCVD